MTTHIKKWDDLNLNTNLLRGIYANGFENPSEIQQRAILPIIERKDVIAQAQSGTGKTGAFSISTLQCVDVSVQETQAIIIAPTRELVTQIQSVISVLGTFMDELNTKLLIGGTSVAEDIEYFSKTTPHIVIGTPGRIFDMIRRRKLHAHTIKLFVLDEADEMLMSEFKTQIYNIFQYFGEKIQVAIFSATMPVEVLDLTNKFMNNPLKLTMKAEDLSLDGIEQFYIATINNEDKYQWLQNLFNKMSLNSTIIFVNDIQTVINLYTQMKKDGFPVCHIHSNLTKNERFDTLNDFKTNKYNILISSNLTARGIDIQQVNLVINLDIPGDVHTYLHRIGRSGRWGRKGTAINFVCEKDVRKMKYIEKHYSIDMIEFTM
jgi:translation initiation factor 4A